MYKKMQLTNLLPRMPIMLMMLLVGFTHAQTVQIGGRVTDGENIPLAGVNVLVKGTGTGTMTDLDGRYSLSNVDPRGSLVFSFIGFVSQEITINDRTQIDLVLQEDVEALDEVVIIGYGSLEKSRITTAISSVRPEAFNRGNINNPAQLLQGKVPGLNIVAPQGNPNGTYNIRLRGLTTIGANTQPLIVIDGVIGSDLNSIDPNDIESIDILKDGGAAAIYGTRGSSGVIIIKTKGGNSRQSLVNYNAYMAVEQMDRSLPVMDREEYLQFGGTDYGANTDWMDQISRTAVSQVHNLSLSGGSEKSTYMASINYRDIQGIVENTGFDQLSGRLNLSQKALGDRLTLSLNLALASKNSDIGFDDIFRSAIIMPPTAPVLGTGPEFDQYGGYFQNRAHELFNPMAIINQNVNRRKSLNSTYNLQADYKLTDELTATLRYAQTNEEITNGKYISRYSLYGSGIDRQGLASQSTYGNKSELFEMTGSYSRSFGSLNLDALLGYSHQELTAEHYFIEVGNFLTDEFSFNNLAAGRDLADGKAKSESFKESNKLIAFFGRVNLGLDNTYFLTASLRREGSSRFGEGNQWGNFVGLSAGLDISRLVEIPFVDQLKLRSSYGVTGALPAQSYLSKQIYGPGSTLDYYLYNDRFTPVYAPQSNPNPDLKWETKSEVDLGLDFRMFNSRLTGTMDYYDRKTSDALITLNVPVPPNLYPTTVLNAGKLQSKGFELGLRFDAIQNQDFQWTPYLNYSNNSSKIISLSMGDIQYGVREVGGLPAPLTGNVVRIEEGKPLGQMIGWVYQGVDSDGNYILKDVDGNGTVNELDTEVIGQGLPKGEIGLGSDFRFKGFDFNFLLRGVYGHDLVNLHRTMFEQISRISTYNLIKTEYFQPEYLGPVAYNSRYVENASFIKLDNISLGYNFKLPENAMISKARVYVTGQNLFYITDYSGVDPEPRYSYDGNVLAPGIEPLNSWVTTRTFTLGASFTF